MMSKEMQYEDIISDNMYDLEMVIMAINELLNDYDWAYEPDARKAIEYGSTSGGNKDEVGKFSYKYINEYKRIIWLVRVARDYCRSALDRCNNIYNGSLASE